MTTATEKEAHTSEEKFFGMNHEHGGDDAALGDDDGTDVILDTAGEDDDKTPVVEAEPEKKVTSDADLDKHSAKVQKRIDTLTWQKNEEKRRADTAESQREEAVRAARAINAQNQNYESIIRDGEATLVNQMKDRSKIQMDAARVAYRAAHEEGDTDQMVVAQEGFNKASNEEQEALRVENDYLRRMQGEKQQRDWQQHQRAQQPRTPVQPQPTKPPPPSQESINWAGKNTWFNDPKHRKMTALAYVAHAEMVEQGIAPDSQSYYDGIDAEMKAQFPDYYRDDGTGSDSSSRTPSAVVASSNRSNGAKPRKVRLKPSEVFVAKELGLTNEQYALQVLKEKKS